MSNIKIIEIQNTSNYRTNSNTRKVVLVNLENIKLKDIEAYMQGVRDAVTALSELENKNI